MTRVYLADAKSEERSALRLLVLDLKMELVGEAADWLTTLAQVPIMHVDILLVEWDLLPGVPSNALAGLRKACPAALVIVLISYRTPVSRPHFQLGQTHLSVKVKRPNVWPND